MKKIYMSGKDKEKFCLVDDEDYEQLSKIKWFLAKGYPNHNSKSLGNIIMHRMIMSAPKGIQVDNINHDILDNRKNNLRLVTNQENARNRLKGRNNTSGHIGVYKNGKKWAAMITVNYKNIYLGVSERVLTKRLKKDQKPKENII